MPQIVHKHVPPCHLRSAHGFQRDVVPMPDDRKTGTRSLQYCTVPARSAGLASKRSVLAAQVGKIGRETCLFETEMQVRCHLVQARITRRV
ncbi:hypothetical protein SVAN01_10361 [Stagonosporopsis vannaccii]|nr:hypothetical protein SVAN01_10361 [Stagonosporopsis vannaccii]